MSTQPRLVQESTELREGAECLLNVMDQRFLVRIIEVTDAGVRASFPGGDYPVRGMTVRLEMHDLDGFIEYPTTVLEGPSGKNTGILLKWPAEGSRNQHRESYRVPTDLAVQVKDQVHVRRYNADLLNISSGGALIESEAPFEFTTTVELVVSLPGEPSHCIIGKVVHINDMSNRRGGDARLFGIRFISPDESFAASLQRYLETRLHVLQSHPRDHRGLPPQP